MSDGSTQRETAIAPQAQGDVEFSSVEDALEDVRRGRMVVVCDGEDRENEGDLVLAAQFATPEAINFMAKEARGLICLALTDDRCDELGLDLMSAKNEAPLQTAFTVSIEAAEGVTTGISAHDRARTVQVAIDPHSGPEDLVQPGHIFPLKAKSGRGARANGAHRGERRPRSARRADPGRGYLRDHERGRDDGPGARPGAVLRAPRAEDDHRRRPDRVPAADRAPDRADRLDSAPDSLRRVHGGRLPLARRREAPRRDGQGRGHREGRRPRPRSQRVPDRGRLPQPALRLRRAARGRAGADRARGRGACFSTCPRRAAGSAS